MITANPGSGDAYWHTGTLVGFDLETTGIDTTTDRIVSAAVVHVGAQGQLLRACNWLVDPGVPIPAAASAVHGVSTEQARAQGRPAAEAVAEIIAELESVWLAGLPVVIFNAPYDLTLLDAEAARYRLPRLATRLWWRTASVIDPLVIDRGLDQTRKGKRTLGATAEHYQTQVYDAHSALGDALGAVAVARAIVGSYPQLLGTTGSAMHRRQADWHQEWALNFQGYLSAKGQTDVVIDPLWPLKNPVVGRHRRTEISERDKIVL